MKGGTRPSRVLPPPPSGHDARLMDATGRPIARHREATTTTDEIVPRRSCLVCSRPTLSRPTLSRPTTSILVCSSPSPVRLRIRRPPPYLRPPAASSPSSSPFSSSVAVFPCLSVALHNVFYGLPIPDLDCRQRLSRRLLHSRFSSSFPPVSLSLSPQRLLRSAHSRPRPPSTSPPSSSPFSGSVAVFPCRLLHSRAPSASPPSSSPSEPFAKGKRRIKFSLKRAQKVREALKATQNSNSVVAPGKNTKYVLVTGGVVSGLGKGVTASSIGVVLKHQSKVAFVCLLHRFVVVISSCRVSSPVSRHLVDT
ncbi:hypothetical protein ACLOJK_008070 [Asimina triloba]